jgi:hypothetical protein
MGVSGGGLADAVERLRAAHGLASMGSAAAASSISQSSGEEAVEVGRPGGAWQGAAVGSQERPSNCLAGDAETPESGATAALKELLGALPLLAVSQSGDMVSCFLEADRG